MAAPKVTLKVKDNANGAGQASAKSIVAVMGVASGLPALISAIVRAGASPTLVTATGTPLRKASIVIDILSTTTFRWSDDDGATWVEDPVTIPTGGSTTYLLGDTGVTADFPAGTYAADQDHKFTITPIEFELFSEPDAVVAKYVSGSLVEAACDILTQDGDKPRVLCGAIPASVAGTLSAVKQTGAGPAVTASGAPLDDYEFIWECLKGGARGVATFRVSVDGGDNWSGEILTSATYPVPGTGVTIAMATGTSWAALDRATFTTNGPGHSNQDLTDACNAFKKKGIRVKFVLLASVPTGASDTARATASAAIAALLSIRLTEWALARIQTHVVMQAPKASKTALETAYASFVEHRITVCATYVEMISAVTSRQHRRPFAWPFASKVALAPLSVDVASVEESGAFPARLISSEHDEDKSPGYDDARFCVPRKWPQVDGLYVCNPRTMAAAGSDFEMMPSALVMNEAMAVVYIELVKICSRRLRRDKKTGTIDSGEANAIDTTVETELRAALASDVVDLSFKINRTDILTGSGVKRLRFKLGLFGFFYAKELEAEGSFADALLDQALAA